MLLAGRISIPALGHRNGGLDMDNNMEEKARPRDELRHEHSELSSNVRHYGSLRFAMLTVYFAVLGGIISVAFGFVEPKTPVSVKPAVIARCAGLFFTIIFFVLETAVDRILTQEVKRMKELERALGYKELASLPKSRFSRTKIAVWFLYIGVGIFWLVSIFLR
jgi:hypothetical protein